MTKREKNIIVGVSILFLIYSAILIWAWDERIAPYERLGMYAMHEYEDVRDTAVQAKEYFTDIVEGEAEYLENEIWLVQTSFSTRYMGTINQEAEQINLLLNESRTAFAEGNEENAIYLLEDAINVFELISIKSDRLESFKDRYSYFEVGYQVERGNYFSSELYQYLEDGEWEE
ncbi:hypothetical protein [Bacillus sp. FJAT-45037]|uniref:hypothetical protein n=1 Tax=Bacillus sp. FJAT-45037 TaxID=2011007 RepID=UPI0012FD3842|nr:hypothetical protein [Bacillus sp. FJAT-45037]